MNILELYSGIGGMHFAFCDSGVPGEVRAAIEINNVATNIYRHNFEHTKLLNLNIEGITADTINKLNVNTILMSPPCQPFTRNGNQNDIEDPRTNSFIHLLDLLPELNIKNILIENVKGFEKSQMRNILIEVLKKNNYICQEFMLSPSQIGIANCRYRYYCLAKKIPNRFKFDVQNEMMESFPLEIKTYYESMQQIGDVIEENLDTEKYALPDNILKKRISILDICYRHSKQSCCFTKAYGRYIEGTGSVFTEQSESYIESKLQQLKTIDKEDAEYLKIAKSLKLRFFTPKEISRLMCFPDRFNFPDNITIKQKYMVLGNSINIRIVSNLIKLLADVDCITQ